MKTFLIRLARSLVLCAGFCAALPCSAATDVRGILGLNRPSLHWVGTVAQETAVLDLMKASGTGMKSVRLGYKGTDSATRAAMIAHIAHCNAIGISVVLEISMQNSAFYPAGTTQRTGNNHLPAAYRFSQLDPNLFETQIVTFLDEAKAANITILAIELGNEPNWAGYNGDLPVYPSTGSSYKILSHSTPWADADLVNFRNGLSKYGTCFYRLSNKANAIFGLNVVKRITAGMADVPDTWIQTSRSSKCTPQLAIQLLEGSNPNQVGATNYLNYAAGVGIHIYPAGAVTTLAATKTAISDYVTPIQNATNTTLPFWITECGYPRARFATETDRHTQHANFINALDQLSFPLAYTHLYTFDNSGGFEVYADGSYLATSDIFDNFY